jgi:hypothetical protein
LTHASVTISSQHSSASSAGAKEFDPQIAWESLRDQLYAQLLKSSLLSLLTRSCSDTKLKVSWIAPAGHSGFPRISLVAQSIRSSMGLPHDKAKLGPDSGSMGIMDIPDPVLSWERKRAQEVVAYVGNKLIGLHLAPDEARTIYNRLVASTWPDAGLKWPPAPREVALANLETKRRIKE